MSCSRWFNCTGHLGEAGSSRVVETFRSDLIIVRDSIGGDMICITGASGTLSSEVIRQLETKALFRAAYFSAAAAEAALARGIEAVTIDYKRPETLRYDELASELTKVLGRSISHVSLSPSDLKLGMLAEGMPEAIAYRMLDLERYFREGRANDITHDIHDVTGREPISFAQYARDTVATGVWDATAPVAHT
jgi:hypothetical protein